jgi:integrase/recombinase XerD
MNLHKINILYILSVSRTRKDKKAPVYCRITYNKKRKTFSTGQFVNPKHWNSKKQKLPDTTEQAELINKQLSLISNKLNQAFLMLQIQEHNFTSVDIHSLYKGEKLSKEYNVIEYFESFLNKLKTLVGIDIKQSTWNKFYDVKQDVKTFIKWKYKARDYPMKKLQLQFINDFEHYLKTVKKHKQITINKAIQRFRKPISVAVAENFIEKDPFVLFKSKGTKKEVIFLSTEELKTLEQYTFSQNRLKFIKDLFVFSCYTGLSYIELMNLRHSNIEKGFDSNLWIKIKRVKTSKMLSIPMLP